MHHFRYTLWVLSIWKTMIFSSEEFSHVLWQFSLLHFICSLFLDPPLDKCSILWSFFLFFLFSISLFFFSFFFFFLLYCYGMEDFLNFIFLSPYWFLKIYIILFFNFLALLFSDYSLFKAIFLFYDSQNFLLSYQETLIIKDFWLRKFFSASYIVYSSQYLFFTIIYFSFFFSLVANFLKGQVTFVFSYIQSETIKSSWFWINGWMNEPIKEQNQKH